MIRKSFVYFLLPIAAAYCFAQSAEPQNQSSNATNPAVLKNMSLEELSQIEVTTPSKQPTKVSQTPAAIYVITGEDIRRSGATSIPEVLRLAPGVEVARIDSSKWSIGIRGFGTRLTRSVLVLIDGRTVFTPLFDGTYWEVQDTMIEDIDRVEVIRGPGGTIWGPNAVDGVINIITKPAKDTQGTLVTAAGGNEEQGSLNARYGGSNGKGVDYRVYGKAFSRAPEVHQDGRNFDDWRSAQGGFRIDWTKSRRDTFTIQGDLYDQTNGESVVADSYSPPFSQTVDANASLSGGNITARWNRVSSDGNGMQVEAYYDRTNRHEPNFGEIRNTFDVDFLDRFRLPGSQQISWGVGARSSPVNDIEVVSGLTFRPNHRNDYLFTAFFQDEIHMFENRLSLTLGTKALRTNFTDIDFEPSVRLLWTPTANASFWAAYTHALRTPSDAEEDFTLTGLVGYLPDGTPYLARFDPNKNFASEQLNGYEAGFRDLLTKKLYLDLTGFYNHYHDLFSEDLAGAPFLETSPQPTHFLLPAQFRNGLLGNTKGVEIAPEWRATDFLRLRGSYSYLHMNIGKAPNSGDIGTIPQIIGSSPAHQFTIQTAVDFSKRLQFDLDYRYVSALPGQYPPNFPNVFVHAYSTCDARFGWRISRQVEASFVGRNLLQPAHAEFAGDPGPLVDIGRSAYVRLTWSK